MRKLIRCGIAGRGGVWAVSVWTLLVGACLAQAAERLPGSSPLLPNAGNLQEQRKQIFDYFQNQIEAAQALRDDSWKPDFSSVDAYQRSLDGKRAALRKMLGLLHGGGKSEHRDERRSHPENYRSETSHHALGQSTS